MNYVQKIEAELSKRLSCGKLMTSVYALLVLTLGEKTTRKDVHDAWSVAVNRQAISSHPSLVPFDELKPEIQAKDQPFVDAIHEVSRIMAEK